MLRLLLKIANTYILYYDVKAENLIIDHLSHIDAVYFLISIKE
jgi:hypothetical protein